MYLVHVLLQALLFDLPDISCVLLQRAARETPAQRRRKARIQREAHGHGQRAS